MPWTLTGTIVEPDGSAPDGMLVAIVSPIPSRSSSGKVIDRDRVGIPLTNGRVADVTLESIPGALWSFVLPAGRRIEITDPGDGAVVNIGADLPSGTPITPDEASLLRAEITRIQAEGLKGDDGDPGKPGDPGHSPVVAMSGDQITVDGAVIGPPLTGPAGPASKLSVGTVTTGAPGSAAAASLSGDAPHQMLGLTIPQGAKGDTGQPTAYELRGTGMPNGSVTASPGTYYTDTAGTNGAWRWIKQSGTGSTGWVVMTADSGWRDITPATLPTTMTAGRFYLRRVGADVTFKVVGLVWASGMTTPFNAFPSGVSLGLGFAPSSPSSQRVAVYVSDVDVVTYDALVPYVAGTSALYLRHMWVTSSAGQSTTAIPSKGRGGSITWRTDDAWPATLPGVAA